MRGLHFTKPCTAQSQGPFSCVSACVAFVQSCAKCQLEQQVTYPLLPRWLKYDRYQNTCIRTIT